MTHIHVYELHWEGFWILAILCPAVRGHLFPRHLFFISLYGTLPRWRWPLFHKSRFNNGSICVQYAVFCFSLSFTREQLKKELKASCIWSETTKTNLKCYIYSANTFILYKYNILDRVLYREWYSIVPLCLYICGYEQFLFNLYYAIFQAHSLSLYLSVRLSIICEENVIDRWIYSLVSLLMA